MNQEQFEEIFERTVDQCREVLVTKAREYASDGDRLHNFKKAAAMNGGTPEQALWGFLTKHLVSLSDMVSSGKNFPDGVWDEKLGDSLNYLFLLRAQISETQQAQNPQPVINFTQHVHSTNQGAE